MAGRPERAPERIRLRASARSRPARKNQERIVTLRFFPYAPSVKQHLLPTALRVLALAAAVAAPPLLAELFLGKLLFSSFSQYVPGPPDPMMYWHEAGSFFRAGFSHGYYGMGEMIPRIGTAWHHGPWYAMLYGGAGRLLGQWTYTTGLVLNYALLGLSCAAYAVLARPRLGVLVLLACFLASFPYLIIYGPSNWSEALMLATALALAGCFVRLFQTPSATPAFRRLKGVTFALLTYAALLRHSFALLYFVFFFLEAPRAPRRILLQAVKAAACVLACLIVYDRTMAPFVTAFTGAARMLHGLMRGEFTLLFATVQANLDGLAEQNPLYTLFLLQALALGVAATLSTGITAWRAPDPDAFEGRRLRAECLLHAVNLLGVLGLLFVYYVVYGSWGQRVLGGHVVLSLFVWAALRKTVLPWALVAVNVVSLPFALHLFSLDRMTEYYGTDALKRQLAEVSREFEGRLAYRPGADPWCNTVLFNGYGRHLLSLPLGVGCQFASEEPVDRVRSRYLVGSGFSQAMSRAPFFFRPLAEGQGAALYENLGGECPP